MGFKETLKRSYNTVKESAIKLGGELKLEHKRSLIEKDLDEMYKTLGMIRYTEVVEDDELSDETECVILEIERLKAELELLKHNKRIKCPVCGKVSQKEHDFCPYCGAKLKEEK